MSPGARKPSILQVCAVDFTARRFLLPLMRAQRAAGFDVHLACAPGTDLVPIAAEGFPVYPVPFRRSYNLAAHVRAWLRLRRLCRRRHFTVVHTHTPVASLIARPAARAAGVPLVLYTAHGFYFHEGMSPGTRRLHVGLERWAQRYADYLFTQSAEDYEDALTERIAPIGRALAIGNGVDVARFGPDAFAPTVLESARRELGISHESGPLVIIIGRLVREKGHFEFLEGFAEARRAVPGARALVIGSALASDHDGAAAAIRRLARELGLEGSVIFAGLRDDVPRLLALGDVFCLPSWREGMPRSLIEAMASGLPVIASDIRGCREEVVHGETGVLVPVRDARALGAALTRLLRDEPLRRRMGRAGRRRAAELFDESIVIERQMSVLRQLFREKGLGWPGAAPESLKFEI